MSNERWADVAFYTRVYDVNSVGTEPRLSLTTALIETLMENAVFFTIYIPPTSPTFTQKHIHFKTWRGSAGGFSRIAPCHTRIPARKRHFSGLARIKRGFFSRLNWLSLLPFRSKGEWVSECGLKSKSDWASISFPGLRYTRMFWQIRRSRQIAPIIPSIHPFCLLSGQICNRKKYRPDYCGPKFA